MCAPRAEVSLFPAAARLGEDEGEVPPGGIGVPVPPMGPALRAGPLAGSDGRWAAGLERPCGADGSGLLVGATWRPRGTRLLSRALPCPPGRGTAGYGSGRASAEEAACRREACAPGGGGGMGGTVCEAPCARGPGSGPAGEVPGGVADALGMAPARGKHESSPTALVARAWPANAIFYRAVCRKGLAEGEGTGFCCSRLDVIVSSLFEGDRAPAVVKTVLGVTERVTRPSVAKDKTCLALSTMVVTA